jgi:general stress protein 26
MTNYNETPYSMMWFPTFKKTTKVDHVKSNPKVLITFPSSRLGEFFEIEGRAELEDDNLVGEKWKWWYLSWLPDEESKHRITSDAPFTNHTIINVYPTNARIVVQPK